MEKRRSLTILSDDNIPVVEAAFSDLGKVHTCAGGELDAEMVRNVDVLLVRSVTRVDEALLGRSSVRFVGSATTGIDHVDLEYLHRRGIAFAHAPGSNAESVVEYVLAVLLRLAVRTGRRLGDTTVGIVGCGNVGGQLAARLPPLGAAVLLNDPPLAEETGRHDAFVPLHQLLTEADVISLHVPLTTAGRYPTHHLVDEGFLQRLSSTAWLLNTSRGAVTDNEALRRTLSEGRLGAAALDVWEQEPTPDPQLLKLVDLATPHVAGYSFDGKVQGTFMMYRALTGHLGVEPSWDVEQVLAPCREDRLTLNPPAGADSQEEWLDALVQQMYDIEADDARLRRLVVLPKERRGAYFTSLRTNYPRRRSFRRHELRASSVPTPYRRAVTEGLGVQLT